MSCQLSVVGCQLSVVGWDKIAKRATAHQSQWIVTGSQRRNYQLPTDNCQLLRLQIAGA